MEDSIFTKIIKGEIPCHKVYEDDRVIAFLSIQPFGEGHTLVVPKRQVAHIWDLDDDDYHYLMSTVKKIGLHLRTASRKDRVGMAVKGFEVPHVHVHLIPMSKGEHVSLDMDDAPMASDDDLARVADRLRIND